MSAFRASPSWPLATSHVYARAFHRRLITSPDRRLSVDQIKHHPFFYGVDWVSIRNIEAPFIPRLRSITDTSYFPTDELEQVPDEPVGADTTGANKDLAFLGCVLVLFTCCASLTSHRGSCMRYRYTFKRFTISSHAF